MEKPTGKIFYNSFIGWNIGEDNIAINNEQLKKKLSFFNTKSHNTTLEEICRACYIPKHIFLDIFNLIPKESLKRIEGSVNNLMLDEDFYLNNYNLFNWRFIFHQRNFSENFYAQLINKINNIEHFINVLPLKSEFLKTQNIIKQYIQNNFQLNKKLFYEPKLIQYLNHEQIFNVITYYKQTNHAFFQYPCTIMDTLPIDDFNFIKKLDENDLIAWNLLSTRSDLTEDFYKQFKKKINLNRFISHSKSLTFKFLIKNGFTNPIIYNALCNQWFNKEKLIDEIIQLGKCDIIFSLEGINNDLKFNQKQFLQLLQQTNHPYLIRWLIKNVTEIDEDAQKTLCNYIKRNDRNLVTYDVLFARLTNKKLINKMANVCNLQLNPCHIQQANNQIAMNILLQKNMINFLSINNFNLIPLEIIKTHENKFNWSIISNVMRPLQLSEYEKLILRRFKHKINWLLLFLN